MVDVGSGVDEQEVVTLPVLSPKKRTPTTLKKKPKIPQHVLDCWRSLHANFIIRHKSLKQTPLKTNYKIVNDWMEGL